MPQIDRDTQPGRDNSSHADQRPPSLGVNLFASLPEPAYSIDNTGKVIAWNLALAEMTGVAEAEILGMDLRNVCTPLADSPRPFAVHALIFGDETGLLEYTLMRQTRDTILAKRSFSSGNNEQIFLENIRVVRDRTGTVEHGTVIIRDLTERSRSIGKKHRDRRDLEQIAQCLLSFGSSPEDNIRRILRTALSRYMASSAVYYSRNTVILREGLTDETTLITPDLLRYHHFHRTRLLGPDGTPYVQYSEPVPHGEKRYLILFIRLEHESPDDSFLFLRLLAHAIATEERRADAERIIEEEEERYQALFDHAPVAIFEEDYSSVSRILRSLPVTKSTVSSPDTLNESIPSLIREVKITGMNRAARSFVQSQRDDNINYMDIFQRSEHGKDLFIRTCTAILTGKTVVTGTDRIWLGDGEPRDIILKWTVPPEDAGIYRRVLVSLVDISEQKKSEFTLELANRRLQTITTITRHDIANIMTSLIGYLELLEGEQNPNICQELIGKAIAQSNLATEFIMATKIYGEIGASEPVWQNVISIIESVLSTNPFPGMRIQISLPDLEICADPMIARVFYTLIENSTRHGIRASKVSISAYEQVNHLYILVKDDGIGIRGDEKEKIFERGFGKHTGWGLFLVRDILSYTGITIRECGIPGKGATFVLIVPRQSYRINQICTFI